MNLIKKKLINILKKSSKGISLDKYIEICLFDEEGYYKKYQPLGGKSDFITAPEISQLFGEIIGLYIYNFWKQHLRCNFNLIELGPGKGTLMSDILRINKNFDSFIHSIDLNLIEINRKLKLLQKNTLLNNCLKQNKIQWRKDIKSVKKQPSIFFANEFFDCFAIKMMFFLLKMKLLRIQY